MRIAFGRDIDKENRKVYRPSGVATLPGKIFINDGRSLSGYWSIDLASKKFTLIRHNSLFGSIGIATDELGFKFLTVPRLIKAKADGVIGTNKEKGTIAVFDVKDQYVTDIVFHGRPSGITVLGDNVFVTDIVNHKVVKIDKKSLEVVGSFGGKGQGNMEFSYPVAISSSDKYLFVGDVFNGRIKVFDENGNFISQYGHRSKLPGCFQGISGLDIDNKGMVYVVDARFREKELMEEISVFASSEFYPKTENVPSLDTKLNERRKAFLGYFKKPYAIEKEIYMPLAIAIDYDNVDYFKDYFAPGVRMEYLIWLVSQYAPDNHNITVFGFMNESNEAQ